MWGDFVESVRGYTLAIIIVFVAALIKLLFALAADPPDDETIPGRRRRSVRNIAGFLSGLLVAAVATMPVIEWFDFLNTNHIAIVGATFALSGEQIVRRVLSPGPIIERLLNRFVGGNEQ